MGLTYHETVNGFYIKTKSLANWFIDLSESQPALYHEGYRRSNKTKNVYIGGKNNYHYHANTEGFPV